MHHNWYSEKSSVPKFSEYSAQEKRYSLAQVRKMQRYRSRFKLDATKEEKDIKWDTSCLRELIKQIKLDPKRPTLKF